MGIIGFETSELNISLKKKEGKRRRLPINQKRIPVPLPKEETDFCRKWKKATAKITEYLRSEKCIKD